MGKGSKLVKAGSWMSKHARNLLQDMPIDNRASGKGPGEYGKPKGPGKHHPDGPMKHGMMHDGPGEYGDTSGNQRMREKTKFTPSGRLKDAPAKYDHKGPGEYGKMKGPGKHGMHKGPGEYGSIGPKLELEPPGIFEKEDKKKPPTGVIEKDKLLGKKRRGSFLGYKIKGRF
jgi:hypothetical protein